MNNQSRSLSSLVFLTLALIGSAACAPDDSPSAPSALSPSPNAGGQPATVVAPRPNAGGTGETKTVKVDNATGGTVALSNGMQLDVPPGALPPGIDTITITSAPTPAPPEYVAASPVHVFGPDGTVFLKPVKVSLPFTLPAGVSASDLTILWSRAHAPGFDMVPTEIMPVSGSATDFVAVGSVTHFSQGFCGVKYENDPHPASDPYAK